MDLLKSKEETKTSAGRLKWLDYGKKEEEEPKRKFKRDVVGATQKEIEE